MSKSKKRHHWIVRVTHWVNVVAIIIMVGSGLQIFNAYPAFARKGEMFCCYPFEHKPIPSWLTFGRWLAGAQMSLADFAAAAQISVADYLGGIDWAGHDEAHGWYRVMKSRPSFRPLLTEKMEGIPPPSHYADVNA